MGRSSACVENVREFSRARDSHLLTPLFSHQNFSPSKVLVCVDEIDVLVVLSKLSPGNNLAKFNPIRPKILITLPGLV